MLQCLNDIDIDVPDDRISELLPDVGQYIEFGPDRYIDALWDLMLLTLNYNGQSIDIGGANSARVFNRRTHRWTPVRCDISKASLHRALGLEVPVVNPGEFIAYKQQLRRVIHIDKDDAKAALSYLHESAFGTPDMNVLEVLANPQPLLWQHQLQMDTPITLPLVRALIVAIIEVITRYIPTTSRMQRNSPAA